MVLTFQINRIQPGLYQVAVLSGDVEVTEPSHHSSIAEAIREEAIAVPEGFAHFAVVTYGGATSGTMALAHLSAQAPQVADQLVAIVAEMHHIDN